MSDRIAPLKFNIFQPGKLGFTVEKNERRYSTHIILIP